MCGILGVLPSAEYQQFKNALMKLAHRGPDGHGIWNDGNQISLGQTRLAILDLSDAGKQPMYSHDGKYAIVLNGEIYNFLEIKNELIQRNYRFQTETDTEVLLYAYIEWKEKCLDKLNGMWAFAVWNSETGELFLARDRFGKKPLFYTYSSRQFVFASEMKAILPFLESVTVSHDFQWLVRHSMIYESTDKCLVEGIKRFPAGNYGIYKDGKLKINRYWCTLDHLLQLPERYEEQIEQFRELFLDACKIRMRSDVPIGTALSGGLDSSAVICSMAEVAKKQAGNRISNDWQHAFVASFPGTFLDESFYAQKVVDHIGVKATYLTINPLNSIEKLEEYMYNFEEIYLTSPIPMVELYGSIKKSGIQVSLDGHGADELFSGYGASLFEAIPDTGLNKEDLNSIFDAYYELFPINDSQFKTSKNRIVEYLNYFLRRKYDKLLRRVPNSQDYDHPNFKKLDHFNKHLYLLTHDSILPTLLRNYDRYAMANGVEIRMPFMDWRIVVFAFSLKWQSKIRNSFTKSIVRDALSIYLPYEIANRKSKIGFNTPTVPWMKNELKNYFLDHIQSRDFKECSLINSQSVKKAVMNVIQNPKVQIYEAEAAWIGFSTYLWEKSFLKGK